MIALASKLAGVLERLEAHGGRLLLLGLFERNDAAGKLDLLIAGRWFDRDPCGSREFFFNDLRASLSEQELLRLSRVVVLRSSDLFLKELTTEIGVENGDLLLTGTLCIMGTRMQADGLVSFEDCTIGSHWFRRLVLLRCGPPFT